MSDIFAPGRGPGSCNGNAQVRPCQGGRQRSVASIRHEACGARARAPACVLRALLCSPWFDCHTPSLPHAHSPPNSSDGCGVLPVIGFWIVFFVFLQFCKAQGVTLMSFHLSFLCVFMHVCVCVCVCLCVSLICKSSLPNAQCAVWLFIPI